MKAMEYHLGSKEIDAINSLPFEARYRYFIKRVADWRTVWTLKSPSGYRQLGTKAGGSIVPVWPHSLFAKQHAVGEWEDAEPAGIALDLWLTRWTLGMVRDQRLVAVFPNALLTAATVTPEILAAAIEKETQKLEQ